MVNGRLGDPLWQIVYLKRSKLILILCNFGFLESCAGKMESLFDLATSNSGANLKIELYTFVLSLLWIEGG